MLNFVVPILRVWSFWGWFKVNCWSLSKAKWLFFVYWCCWIELEVLVSQYFRHRKFIRQWIGVVHIYAADVLEAYLWTSRRIVMFLPMVFIPFVFILKAFDYQRVCFITVGTIVLCVAAISDGRLQALRWKPLYLPTPRVSVKRFCSFRYQNYVGHLIGGLVFCFVDAWPLVFPLTEVFIGF